VDSPSRAHLRRHLVVFVDDDRETLEALRRLLRETLYRFWTTQDAHEALRWVGANDVSLVVSDQRMPVMSGTRLLNEVYRRSPATGRVLLTAYPQEKEISRALGEVVQGVIAKPWDGWSLKRTILALLRWREEREGSSDEENGLERS